MRTRSRDDAKQAAGALSAPPGGVPHTAHEPAASSGPVALAGAGPRPRGRVKMRGLIPDHLGGMRLHYPPGFLLRDMGLDPEDVVLRRWAARYLHWRRIRRERMEEAAGGRVARMWRRRVDTEALAAALEAHQHALAALAYLRSAKGLSGNQGGMTDG